MSNQEQKIYVPKASAKEVTFKSGKTIFKLSFHAETVAAFLKQHANEKGYVNFGVSKRNEVGKFGDTHAIWLDTWQPNRQDAPQPQKRDDYKDVSRNYPEPKPRLKPGEMRPELKAQLEAQDDGLPF